MLVLLLPLLAARAAAPPRHPGPVDAPWAAVVVCDEVRVELDTAAVDRRAPAAVVRARLLWSLLAPAVSPAAWGLGVRTTVDDVEVDCASASSRTVASRAFAADGAPVGGGSFASASAPWRRHADGSVGGMVVAAVCRAAAHA